MCCSGGMFAWDAELPASEEVDAICPVSEQSLSAVFFLHLSLSTVPMIKAWLHEGHRISAIVVFRQPWPKFFPSPVQWIAMHSIVLRLLRRHRVEIIEMKTPPDWDELQAHLTKARPDVAVCYGFMRLLPERLLSVFPSGALNFHPALLPYYRGPKPFHWLALDNAWQKHGGLTLHEMTDRFDEGPIVAQVSMSEAEDITGFMSQALACMTRHVIPKYCAGNAIVWPQPPGIYPYASATVPAPVVQVDWTGDQVRALCKVFVRRPGISIGILGKKVRLLEEIRRIGPPSGVPPVKGPWSVEFDLADGRVLYRRYNPISKLGPRLRALRRLWRREPAGDLPIWLGPPPAPGRH
jgi:methionyl-tRNA formyltransferase